MGVPKLANVSCCRWWPPVLHRSVPLANSLTTTHARVSGSGPCSLRSPSSASATERLPCCARGGSGTKRDLAQLGKCRALCTSATPWLRAQWPSVASSATRLGHRASLERSRGPMRSRAARDISTPDPPCRYTSACGGSGWCGGLVLKALHGRSSTPRPPPSLSARNLPSACSSCIHLALRLTFLLPMMMGMAGLSLCTNLLICSTFTNVSSSHRSSHAGCAAGGCCCHCWCAKRTAASLRYAPAQ
mmetsp:Transcript_8105/g.29913  ORF Transcript_8105/g.29913 Transcript_8105/m.29913 type:complete len:246 (-) Transcript_8105:861-1598(-)